MLLPLCLFSNSNTHSKPYQYIICIFFPNKLYQSVYIVNKLKNKQVQQLKIIFASLPFAFFIELRGIAYKKSRQSRRRDFLNSETKFLCFFLFKERSQVWAESPRFYFKFYVFFIHRRIL